MAKKKKKGKVIGLIVLAILAVGALVAYKGYNYIYTSNVECTDCKYVYIPTGADFDDVVSLLQEGKIIKDTGSFKLVAKYMKYANKVKPGKYAITPKMSNKDLIYLLRSGKQTEVKLTLNASSNIKDIAKSIAEDIEADETELYNLLKDKEYLHSLGYTPETVFAMFIPDTYFFRWNTSADEALKRFANETKKFWEADNRVSKVQDKGLDKMEAVILASIVDKETNKVDEMPTIAGLYLNRFQKGWKLQADPTVKYALGKPGLRRVLKVHTEYASPYNTYHVVGLPPGPICLPSKQALNAVINSRKHDYMFMCASVDKPGYHAFAVTNREHELNARKYHRYLNSQGIK